MASEVATVETTEPAVSSDVLYEVIDGEIVELPPMGNRQEHLASELQIHVGSFTLANKLGWTVMERLFDFTEQMGKKRRPALAFVNAARWPMTTPIPEGDGWQVVPNLTAEFVSPSNGWEEIQSKIGEYFQIGVERVWVISTAQKQVHVYDTPTSVRILTTADQLTDDALLPGFQLSLNDLFALVQD